MKAKQKNADYKKNNLRNDTLEERIALMINRLADPELHLGTYHSLVEIGEPALPYLKEAAKTHPSEQAQYHIRSIIGDIQNAGKQLQYSKGRDLSHEVQNKQELLLRFEDLWDQKNFSLVEKWIIHQESSPSTQSKNTLALLSLHPDENIRLLSSSLFLKITGTSAESYISLQIQERRQQFILSLLKILPFTPNTLSSEYVPLMKEALQSQDSNFRIASIIALSRKREVTSIPAIFNMALNDNHPLVQATAISALPSFEDHAAQYLFEQLETYEDSRRRMSTRVIAKINSNMVIEQFVQILKSDNTYLCYITLQTLVNNSYFLSKPKKLLDVLISLVFHPWKEIRSLAALALRPYGKPALWILHSYLEENNVGDCLLVVDALGSIQNPLSIQVLIELTQSQSERIAVNAAKALQNYNEKVLFPHLIAALNSIKIENKEPIVKLLAGMGKLAVKPLFDSVTSGKIINIEWASRTLRYIGNDGVQEFFRLVFKQPSINKMALEVLKDLRDEAAVYLFNLYLGNLTKKNQKDIEAVFISLGDSCIPILERKISVMGRNINGVGKKKEKAFRRNLQKLEMLKKLFSTRS